MSLTPSTIVSHLKSYLPRFTDMFTETLTVSAADISAGNILTVTATAHGKTPGQYILITTGTVRNSLIASSLIDPTVKFTTGYDHDLTKPHLKYDDYYLTMGGFSSTWNGQHEIIEVSNRRNFEVNLPSGEVAAPAVDGSQYLLEALPKGVYQIATTPDLNTLTIDLSSARTLPIGMVDGLEIVSGYRISAAADINRARDVYGQQSSGNAYLFVIMSDTDVSKDRYIENDSISELTRKGDMFLRLIQSFSTTVFIPTTEDIAGASAQDLAYDEIFDSLLRSLFGFSIDGSLYRAVCIPAGMGQGEYNSAFYTHVYDWQLPFTLNFEAGIPQETDIAFRNMDYNHLIGGDDTTPMTITDIDLDEEPL